MHRNAAFTLIELLIVVAIIAILAAIAVPNLLEAQVRSKVSRVKADMRSYATALEAYAVDANDYPPTCAPCLPNPAVQPLETLLIRLSTPIAYMSQALVPEPFNGHKGWILYRGWDVVGEGGPPPDAGQRQPIYLYGSLPGDELVANGIPLVDLLLLSVGISLTDDQIKKMLSDRWILVSPGPDTFYYFDQLLTINASPNILGSIFGQVSAVTVPELNIVYDPTNGTTSRGDIARNGGGLALEKK